MDFNALQETFNAFFSQGLGAQLLRFFQEIFNVFFPANAEGARNAAPTTAAVAPAPKA